MQDMCVGYAATPSGQVGWGARNVWQVPWKQLAGPHCDICISWTGRQATMRFLDRNATDNVENVALG